MSQVLAVKEQTVDAEFVNPSQQIVTDDFCEFTSDNEIIADWLKSKSHSTAKAYWSAIKQFGEFAQCSISGWTKKLILAYLEGLRGDNKVSTINKKLACIRSLLSHCVNEGYLTRNVATNIKKVREDKTNVDKQSLEHTERVIGCDNVWTLINSASSQRDRVLLKTCYLLGLRVHELCKIHWQDISPDGNRHKLKVIGKNDKVAFLPVDNKLIAEWKELSSSGYVFKSRKFNGKLDPSQMHRILKKSAKNAGLDSKISVHWLRHQRCSDLVNSGKYTLSQVQKFMRHSSPAVTATYIHVNNEIGSDALLDD